MNYFAVDTETTGFHDPYPVEIAAVRVQDIGAHNVKFSKRIKCVKPIHERASLIHKIYDSDLINEMDEKYVLEEFINFLSLHSKNNKIVLIAHNATYDKKVIDFAMKRHNLIFPFEVDWQCTMSMAKKVQEETKGCKQKFTLGNLCVEKKIECNNAHQALADATMCAYLYNSFFKLTPEQEELDNVLDKVNEEMYKENYV
jgi:DNA polymerase III alpha subunit (gram-positive type)